MTHLDRTLHPDIHAVNDIAEAIRMIVFSCGCMTKTPEPGHHEAACRYRHLATRIKELDIAAKHPEF